MNMQHKDIKEVSNCCGARVEGSNGKTGRCSECKEGCVVVKFESDEVMEKTIAERLKAEMPYKWKIQGYNKAKTKAQCVAYIDARDLMDRLDEVMGIQNWRDSYRRDQNGRLICTLELKFNDEWVAKEDTGTEGNYEKEKSEFSDAFKRAGVKWGIGRFLYDMDIQWLDVKDKKLYDDNVLVKSYQLTEYLNNKLKSKKASY